MPNAKAKGTRGRTTSAVKPRKPARASKKKRVKHVNIEKLRELAKTHKPPQSWYDEDHTGLY